MEVDDPGVTPMHQMREVRTEAGEVRVGTEACLRNLLDALGDEDPKVRRLAVCGLAASGDTRAVEPLIGALGDADEDVRTRAALALGKLGDRRAAPALVRAALGDDPPLHRAAVLALGELDAGLDVLARALGSREPAERIRAAIALGETHDVAAVAALTEALDDPDPGVRHHVREALEKIRETRVF